MLSSVKNYHNPIKLWLSSIIFLIFSMIVVGGLTRLTDSGLSITEWELFSGILPPFTQNSWTSYFELYKETPQYKFVFSNMSLNEFKIIFYWEYIHRLLARFIGLFFIIPLIFFHISKKVNKEYINVCYIIFILITFQGIIGWYMVKSGLVNDVTVSHYRLSIHLVTAIFIFSSIFWLLRNATLRQNKPFFKISKNFFPFQLLILLIFAQIIIGAFVSGLDAGKIYQTWPLMGNNFFPNDLLVGNLINIVEFNNHSLVQFYHRNLAYLIILYILFLSSLIYKKKIFNLYKPLLVVLFITFTQVILGVTTLLSGLNIYLASAHQITSILLVFSALNLYYLRTK